MTSSGKKDYGTVVDVWREGGSGGADLTFAYVRYDTEPHGAKLTKEQIGGRGCVKMDVLEVAPPLLGRTGLPALVPFQLNLFPASRRTAAASVGHSWPLM